MKHIRETVAIEIYENTTDRLKKLSDACGEFNNEYFANARKEIDEKINAIGLASCVIATVGTEHHEEIVDAFRKISPEHREWCVDQIGIYMTGMNELINKVSYMHDAGLISDNLKKLSNNCYTAAVRAKKLIMEIV